MRCKAKAVQTFLSLFLLIVAIAMVSCKVDDSKQQPIVDNQTLLYGADGQLALDMANDMKGKLSQGGVPEEKADLIARAGLEVANGVLLSASVRYTSDDPEELTRSAASAGRALDIAKAMASGAIRELGRQQLGGLQRAASISIVAESPLGSLGAHWQQYSNAQLQQGIKNYASEVTSAIKDSNIQQDGTALDEQDAIIAGIHNAVYRIASSLGDSGLEMESLLGSLASVAEGSSSALKRAGVASEKLTGAMSSLNAGTTAAVQKLAQNVPSFDRSQMAAAVQVLSQGAVAGVSQNEGVDNDQLATLAKGISQGSAKGLGQGNFKRDEVLDLLREGSKATVVSLQDNGLNTEELIRGAGSVSAGASSAISQTGLGQDSYGQALESINQGAIEGLAQVKRQNPEFSDQDVADSVSSILQSSLLSLPENTGLAQQDIIAASAGANKGVTSALGGVGLSPQANNGILSRTAQESIQALSGAGIDNAEIPQAARAISASTASALKDSGYSGQDLGQALQAINKGAVKGVRQLATDNTDFDSAKMNATIGNFVAGSIEGLSGDSSEEVDDLEIANAASHAMAGAAQGILTEGLDNNSQQQALQSAALSSMEGLSNSRVDKSFMASAAVSMADAAYQAIDSQGDFSDVQKNEMFGNLQSNIAAGLNSSQQQHDKDAALEVLSYNRQDYQDPFINQPEDRPTVVAFAEAEIEVAENAGSLRLTIKKNQFGKSDIQLAVRLLTGSATQGQDFVFQDTSLTIGKGAMKSYVLIDILDDSLNEADETFRLELYNPELAELGDNTILLVHIVDNDPLPKVSFVSTSQSSQGEAGEISVSLALSDPSGRAVSVAFALDATSSAMAESDFNLTPSPLIFAPGSKTSSITINIVEDIVAESPERVILLLEQATHAELGEKLRHEATIVDDDSWPMVTSVSGVSGTYGLGDEITIAVAFSEAVEVSGNPILLLTGEKTALYQSGSSSQLLYFVYTVSDSDNDADLDYASNAALMKNGGSILATAHAANQALLLLPPPGSDQSLAGSSDIALDTTVPTIEATKALSTSGDYRQGSHIDIELNFSEPVVVSGQPRILLDSDNDATPGDSYAIYHTGSAGNNIIFRYTVSDGENIAKLSYSNDALLDFNGGAIADLAGNSSILTLPAPQTISAFDWDRHIAIDTQTPRILGVASSMPDGVYGHGQSIEIAMTLSEPVVVSGTPALKMNTSPENVNAIYQRHDGNVIYFTLAIDANHSLISNKLDYSGIDALDLAGGSVSDAAGNLLDSILPVQGSPGSLSFGKSIAVADVMPAVVVSAVSGSCSESGGQAEFSLNLSSTPRFDVSLTITSTNENEIKVYPKSLVFSRFDWNAPQKVTLSGQDDDLADGDQTVLIVIGNTQSADAAYQGLEVSNVSVINKDSDTAGITVNPVHLTTTESGLGSRFSIVLNSIPTADVSVSFSSSDESEVSLTPDSVVFTPDNYNAPRWISVSGIDDLVKDGDQTITIAVHAAVSDDLRYHGLDAEDVLVVNQDDESAGFTINQKSDQVSEGGDSANFSLVLNSQPSADVSISFHSLDTSEGVVAPSSVIFTPANWNAPREIIVSGVDDPVFDGNQLFAIDFSAAVSDDDQYNGLKPLSVNFTNIDNDLPGINSGPVSANTDENGAQARFYVWLNTRPGSNVVIDLSSSNTNEGIATIDQLIFTSLNWNSPQAVIVRGVNDDVQDGNQSYSIRLSAAQSQDAHYDGLQAANKQLINIDNDSAGITVSALNGQTSESGDSADFSIVLNSEPVANVAIALSVSRPDEANIYPQTVIFTPQDWNIAKVIAVSGIDDDIQDGNQPFSVKIAAASSQDAHYHGLKADDLAAVNLDNDTAGILTSAISGNTHESGLTAIFSIRLQSQPTDDVLFDISSSNTKEALVSPGNVVFTPQNWNQAQIITITGQNDYIQDGNQNYFIIVGDSKSNDANYNNLVVDDYRMSNIDDDTAGIVVSRQDQVVDEGGGSAVFSVMLSSEPIADVSIGVSSSNLSEGIVSVDTLRFTAANWNVPQSVNVSGVDDSIADGDRQFSVILAPAVSMDANYQGMDTQDLLYTNRDNDTVTARVVEVLSDRSDGSYSATESIAISVVFSEAVNVVGSPRLALQLANGVKEISYSSGSGSDRLNFVYTIASGDNSSLLAYNGSDALLTNGATIRNALGSNADLTLPESGSTASLSAKYNIRVDTLAPTAPGSISLAATDDTGLSNSDAITNMTTGLTLSGSGEALAMVGIYEQQTLLVTTQADALGSWQVDVDLAEGSRQLRAIQRDAAGNASLESPVFDMVIDITAPNAPEITGIITGIFSNDQIFSVSASSAANSLEYSLDGGVIWQSFNAAVTLSTEGSYSVTARQTDLAGNVSIPAAAINVGIDRTPPSGAISISPVGSYKSGDNIILTVAFSEVMKDSPVPQIAINGVNTLAASNMTKVSSTLYSYAYTVSPGKGTATMILSTGVDLAGHSITSTPTAGATFTISNTTPTADDISLTTTEDASGSVPLTGTDPDGDSLTFAVATDASLGSCTISGATLTYTPNANANGADFCTFTASDGAATSAEATVSVTITAVNDAPVFSSSAITSATQDVAYSYTITATDADSGATLTISASTLPAWLSLTDNGDGTASLTGTPANGDVGNNSVVLEVSDGIAAAVQQSFTISVANVNDAPTADDISLTTAEDTSGSVTLTGTDPDGDSLTFAVATDASLGSCTISGATLTYTPNANANGADSCTITASDGAATSAEATVSVTITAVNDAPVFSSSAITSAIQDLAYSYTITATDADSGDSLTISASTLPAWLSFTDNGDGTASLTGTPANGDVGNNSVVLEVSDGIAAAVQQSFTISVANVNDAPTADDNSLTTTEDTSGSVTLTGTDPDGDSLTFAVATDASLGSCTISGATLTYTPNANANGADSCTVTASDGAATSAEATISVTITAVNDAPTADDKSVTTLEDASGSVTLTGTDPDGDSLTFAVATDASLGSCTISGTTLTYTPNANANGADFCTFTASDGAATSAVATVSVTITAVNDAPTADDKSLTTTENVSGSVTLTGTDPDGDSLTFAVATDASLGSCNISGATLTYTPNANANGWDFCTVTASDGTATSAEATISVTITVEVIEPEINISQGATDIPSGGSYDFGLVSVGDDSGDISFTIENSNTGLLYLQSNPQASISGANASDFIITQPTVSEIANGASVDFLIRFQPATAGFRTATITIQNNDLDEGSYQINLTGEGDDSVYLETGPWTMVKLIAEQTTNDTSWSAISMLKYGNDYYYGWYGAVEHWNHSNSWFGTIDAVEPATGNHTLLSTLVYDSHPYSNIFNFRVNMNGLVEDNGTFYAFIVGNPDNLGTTHSIAIIKSIDNGTTWTQHQLVAQYDGTNAYTARKMIKVDNTIYIYYGKYNGSSWSYYYIASDTYDFQLTNSVSCNEIVNTFSSVLKYGNLFYGFIPKADTNGNYQVYKVSSASPDFSSPSSETVFMSSGISAYDTFSIYPSFFIETGFIYAIARTDPWAPTDYGFNNASKIVLYKAALKEIPTAGQAYAHTVDTVNFTMVYVPPKTFFTGENDLGTASVSQAYLIGETEVTYELWYAVYQWAVNGTGGATGEGQYTFANAGREGHDGSNGAVPTAAQQEPVTTINWRDSIVWSNALTEYYNAINGANLDVVYYTDSGYTIPLRDSSDGAFGVSMDTTAGSFDMPYIKAAAAGNTDMANCTAKGFRLPTMQEWELAARYKDDLNDDGDIMDAGEYYPGGYASGATADYNDATATGAVAWYSSNSGSSTKDVKTKATNALGLYDMSGNVWEWNFDWHPSYVGSYRVMRGGSWNDAGDGMRVGYLNNSFPYHELYSYGFRLSRTGPSPATDAEAVATDLAMLAIGYASGDTASSVTQDMTLATSGSNATAITWSAAYTSGGGDASGVVASDGTVTRPSYGSGDAEITLTATITKGSASDTKAFTITVKEIPTAGQAYAHTVDTVNFTMVYVPPKSFFTNTDDSSTDSVAQAYLIGETEVTYELWYAVYQWAVNGTGGATGEGQYTFANAGREGNDGSIGAVPTAAQQEPVTTINWRDSIVWSNALTEYYNATNGANLDVVYYTDSGYTTPLRDSSDGAFGLSVDTTAGSFDMPYIKAAAAGNTDMANCTAKGFRLPTMQEWELAARYKDDLNDDGDIMDAEEYYPGSYASGATADYNDATATGAVAWYSSNSGSSPKDVKTRAGNALGLYDMSGNVWEWNFDWHPLWVGSSRVMRGGGWIDAGDGMRVGGLILSLDPYGEGGDFYGFGFRLSRTL